MITQHAVYTNLFIHIHVYSARYSGLQNNSNFIFYCIGPLSPIILISVTYTWAYCSPCWFIYYIYYGDRTCGLHNKNMETKKNTKQSYNKIKLGLIIIAVQTQNQCINWYIKGRLKISTMIYMSITLSNIK